MIKLNLMPQTMYFQIKYCNQVIHFVYTSAMYIYIHVISTEKFWNLLVSNAQINSMFGKHCEIYSSQISNVKILFYQDSFFVPVFSRVNLQKHTD